MAITAVSLPVVTGTGVGAAVDTSGLGAAREIILGPGIAGGQITIEASNDNVNWAPVVSVTSAGKRQVLVASMWMRARSLNYSPGPLNIDIAAEGITVVTATVPAPPSSGAGAQVDISALGDLVTFAVSGGVFVGAITLEISQDGTDWAGLVSFTPDQQTVRTIAVAAVFCRARSSSTVTSAPSITAAGAPSAGGGGGGPPSGPAGGDLAGTYPNPTVTQARGLRETAGPTTLAMGAVAAGQVLQRSGATVIGADAVLDGDAASGDLGGTYPGPTVTQARGLRETAGPTTLAMGAVAAGQVLQRSGATVIGADAVLDGDAAGGQLGSTYPNPDVRGLRETAGPTLLTMGAVADGDYLQRSGATIIGVAGVAGPPTGAAGGQLGGTYPNPDVRGLRETAGPTLLTMGAVADGEYLVRSGANIIGGAGGSTPQADSNLWVPVSRAAIVGVPSDDEFDSGSVAGWTFTEVTTPAVATQVAVQAYTANANSQQIGVNATGRASWVLLQPTVNGTQRFAMTQAITLPTNLLIWCRLKMGWKFTPANNDFSIGLSLWANSGGNPDNNNYIAMMLSETDLNAVQPRYFRNTAGVPLTISSGSDMDQLSYAWEYVAIHKIGVNYHAWAGTDHGNWLYMGSTTAPASLVYVGFQMINQSTTNPANAILGVDFIRFVDTDNFLL